MSRNLDWARHEVALALAREMDYSEDGGFEYAKGCYDSALKAFASICEDGHSGLSFSLTRRILDRLLSGRPLTPVEDKPEEWNESWKSNDGIKHYQHKRLSSLFKDEFQDGKVEYTDTSAYECVDEDSGIPYHGGGSDIIIRDFFTVKFPYSPPVRKYRLVTRDYLTDRKNGDFDTKIYKKIIDPDGTIIPVYRFFKYTKNGQEEIDWNEFLERTDQHNKREEKERNNLTED